MILALITIIGLVLRLILSNQSFWLDEGASLMFAKLPLPQMLEYLKTDFHPPFFYTLLHVWLPLAGKSEWLIRLPFILLASATIPALYLATREIFGKNSEVPWLSALFLALNPLHIYYSQELRMYSLVTLLVVLSWYFLLKKKFLAVSTLNLLSLFTFYGAIFNFVSQLLYLLIVKPENKLRSLALIFAPSALLFLWWWPVFNAQLANGQYLKQVLPGWQILSGSLTLKSLILIPLKFILGRISLVPQNLYFLAGGAITFLFFIIISGSLRIKKSLPLWLALAVPLLLGIIISLKTPVLGYWRFLFVLPFFLALLAIGVQSLPKIIFIGTVVWIAGVFLFSNIYFWTNIRFQREDWRGLADFINGKDSLVLIAFPYNLAPLDFYATDASMFPVLDESYKQLPYFQVLLEEKTSGKTTVFYLDYLADVTDPERKILRSLSQYSLRQVGVYNFNNLGQVYEFRPL